jgi:hypothetical protein
LGSDIRWSDNIEGEETGAKSDFYFTPSLYMELEGTSKESSLSTSGSFRGEVYTRHDELNDFSVPGLNSTYRTKISENLSVSLSARFSYEPNSSGSSDSIIVIEGEGGIPVTTSITGRTDTYSYGGNGNIDFKFTERVYTSLEGSYSTTQYTQDTGGLSDEKTYSGGVSLFRQMTQKLTMGLSSSYSNTDFDSGTDTDVISGTASADYAFTPTTSVSFSGGLSSTDTGNQSRNTDLIGSAGLRTSISRTSIVVDLSRSVSGEGSSFGRTTQRDNGRVALVSPFLRRGRYSLVGSISHNVSPDDEEDNVVVSATLEASYPVFKYVSIIFSARTSHQDARGTLGDNVDINEVGIGFVASHIFQ